MATYRSELENARHELAEGLDRVREQAALIDRLHKEGKPIEAALDLLAAMRATVTRIETHIRFLIETEGRQD